MRKLLSVLAFASLAGMISSSFGVAVFARQTGLECNTCHTSAGFPTLTKMGQDFKAGSYASEHDDTMIGDGEALSLPRTMPIGFVLKARAWNLNDGSESHTGVDIWDEAVIFLGGKIGKNSGYVIEWGEGQPLAARWSFGVVHNESIKTSIVVFTVDGWGPGAVFEAQSTGAVKNMRVFENKEMNSAAASVDGWGESTGIGAYVYHDMFYAAIALYAPVHHATHDDFLDPAFAQYIRAVVTPIEGLGIGAALKTGTAGFLVADGDWAADNGITPGVTVEVAQSTMVFDVQYYNPSVLGGLLAWATYGSNADTHNEVTVSLGSASATSAGDVAKTYITVGADVSVIPNKANVGLGYRKGDIDSGAYDDSGIILQAKYNVLMNARLQAEYYMGQGDNEDSSMMLMLFGSW